MNILNYWFYKRNT